MALTRSEARERSQKIWGDQVLGITVRPYTKDGKLAVGEWMVRLHNGEHHSLDGNGHADCHQTCADCEAQVCT